MEHAVRADEGLLPGFRAEETGLEDEGDGLGQEMVEVLDGNLDALFLVYEGLSKGQDVSPLVEFWPRVVSQ